MSEDTFTEVGQYRPSIRVSPGFRLDYYFDWANWCQAISDSIFSKTIEQDGVTVESSQIVDGETEDGDTVPAARVQVWLTEKTAEPASVTCHIVTAGGRRDSRTIYLLDR